MAAKRSGVVLTRRDRALVHTAWSLGWVTSAVLTAVVSPATSVKTLSGRLSELADAGYLRRRRVVAGPHGHLWLYGAGRNAGHADVSYANAWRPSDAQLLHTLDMGTALAALLVPGRLGAITVTGWQGEAELRRWHEPGTPVPDLLVRWRCGAGERAWAVEVDRGTEARAAWRRKLSRYLHTSRCEILVVTTSDERARNLARLARELGAPAISTHLRALEGDGRVEVYDAIKGCRRPVDA